MSGANAGGRFVVVRLDAGDGAGPQLHYAEVADGVHFVDMDSSRYLAAGASDVTDLPDMPHVKYVGEILNNAPEDDGPDFTVPDVGMADVSIPPDASVADGCDVNVSVMESDMDAAPDAEPYSQGAEMPDISDAAYDDGAACYDEDSTGGELQVSRSVIAAARQRQRQPEPVVPDITITVRPNTSANAAK